ncbi:uncharacterized protein LOC126212742 [Schistocerca nitens]|uniref:uncharacterized protein LOC126212742 n=1 Tax=Schistocerca nitens TaxID=7011 RepID=UPI0021177AD3|nr:uncharacterized protein LOC126212742 [Schistocerca nitens]
MTDCINAQRDYPEEDAIATVREAIRKGTNYIDTAPFYGLGRSEEVLGKALKGIPRQAYYIATKVACYTMDPRTMFDFSVQKTRESVAKSLELLQLDYVDVIQVHDVEFALNLDIIIQETLPVLQELVAKARRGSSASREKGVGVICVAGTAMALLSSAGPQLWQPASQELQDVCRAAADYCKVRIESRLAVIMFPGHLPAGWPAARH